jgi:hypothetical protein
MNFRFITSAFLAPLLTLLSLSTLSSCHRGSAQDITPGHYKERMDWRYGAADIRIQTSSITGQLMDRWFAKTAYDCQNGKPTVIISEIDNCTDRYISTDMIRDIIESIAVDDGRYTIVVGNELDESELDARMQRIQLDPKYNNASRLNSGQALAPQLLAKIRLTKAVTSDRFYDYEDYRMTITLYDIETQAIVDSAWDVLSKRVNR